MSFDDVSEMIRRILEEDDVSREFCELIYGKTRGNPFFVEEVIKSLKEEEIIYREDSKWKIKEVSKIESEFHIVNKSTEPMRKPSTELGKLQKQALIL